MNLNLSGHVNKYKTIYIFKSLLFNMKINAKAICLPLSLILFAITVIPSNLPAENNDKNFDPKASQVLDRFMELSGGIAAYDKIINSKMTGSSVIKDSGIKMKLISYNRKPSHSYSLMESEMTGKLESGTNGTIAWEMSVVEGPQLMEGSRKDEAIYLAKSLWEGDWRKLNKKATYDGENTIDGKVYQILTMTPGQGPVSQVAYDKETGLIYKIKYFINDEVEKGSYSMNILKYKRINGVLVPVILNMETTGSIMDITIDSVEFNIDIPESIFKTPPEIEALINKKKQ